LRAEGWITVAELSDTGDAQAQAEHQGCTHIFEDGEAREITKPKTT